MRYTLLLHYPERTAEELGPEALAEGMRAFQAYAKALDDAGVLVSAEVLQQSNATTTVTHIGGELVVQEGPFADTKEQLGGSFVITSQTLTPRSSGPSGHHRCRGVMSRSDRPRPATWTARGRSHSQSSDRQSTRPARPLSVRRGSPTAGSWPCWRHRHETLR